MKHKARWEQSAGKGSGRYRDLTTGQYVSARHVQTTPAQSAAQSVAPVLINAVAAGVGHVVANYLLDKMNDKKSRNT